MGHVFRSLIAVTLLGAGAAQGADSGGPDFRGRILPLLSNTCFKCHGPDENTREGGLRLDVEADARRAFEAKPDAMSLFMERVTAADPADRMPPPDSGLTLSESDIAALREWIDAGAKYETHWAFVAPERPEVPAPSNAAWTANAIDAFILAKLEERNIVPAPEADPVTLLRRLSLDLTGLPPAPEDIDAFTADPSPQAYEAAVDRYLASPHFGERWGRHWLDAARYADTHGYSIDGDRSIWPYRDWVINALNANMPFDQFVVEQLAGDLLPGATRDQRIATGFHRNTMINQEGGVDDEEFRQEAVHDRVATTGTVFLGLTTSCARCHTHKYDPILHTEYFQLFAFYNNDDEPTLDLASPEQEQVIAAIRKDIAAIEAERDAYFAGPGMTDQAEWERGLPEDFLKNLEPIHREAITTPAAERSEDQVMAARNVFRRQSPQAKEFESRIAAKRAELPAVPSTMVLAARPEPRVTRLLLAGDYTRPADPVTPGVPAALHPLPDYHGGTRLDLARWLIDARNPLMARVTVNRYWQQLFGRGLVETENDFGLQGARPTHPALLDWLAVEFIASGWDVKGMIKAMVMSAAYRQSSFARPELDAVDARNLLLARQTRLRLDAEIIRDAALSASGLLNPAIGGPGVYPPIPDGVMNLGQRARDWPVAKNEDRYRRGMYTYFVRGTPYPSLTVFDAPDAQTACTRRVRSNTPLQALTLLNDAAYIEMAEGFAARLLDAQAAGDADRVALAFRHGLGRTPTAAETAIVQRLLASERESLVGAENAERTAWTAVARAILNLDEFITRE